MSRRNLLIALLVSVAVNCLAAGVLVGQRYWGRPAALGPAAFERLAAIVPEPSRDAVRDQIRGRRLELFRALRELRQARVQVRTVAAAEPLSDAELEAAMARLRQATDRIQRILHGAIVEGIRHSRAPVPAHRSGPGEATEPEAVPAS